MQSSNKIFRLEGVIQHYAWGGSRFIPALLQQENQQAKPFAEYWLGAHDKAPARVCMAGGEKPNLNVLIKEDPIQILGEKVASRFGRLPYLLKILDVKDMLSIQVHPDKESAEIAFEEENRKGISIDVQERNYKDANHKPELMVALSDFWLLHGFKPKQQLLSTLNKIPELTFLGDVFNQRGYQSLYKTVMDMPQVEVNNTLQPLLTRIIPLYKQNNLSKDQEDFWAARAALTYNSENHIDRGIFSIYFFNLLHCKPGEAVFQDAGVPHAYLEGQNVEIMANSDNVLRGGLTSKHIDVSELMKHIRFEGTDPTILKGKKRGDIEEVYETPAPDFQLSRFVFYHKGSALFAASTAEILFVEKGLIKLMDQENELMLASGEAAIIISGTSVQLYAEKETVLYRASVSGSLDD